MNSLQTLPMSGRGSAHKCVAPQRLMAWVGVLPRPLVFASGVFDLLHVGHVTLLEAASHLGATLVVALNGDSSAKALGKPGRAPHHTLVDRARVVASLGCVSWVTRFDDATPESLILGLRPDVYVKGGDYRSEELPEAAHLSSWGGRLHLVPYVAGHSSTALMGRLDGDAR